MKALGGSFVIQSTPAHGTTATLMLPLAKSDELSEQAVTRHASVIGLSAIVQHSALKKNATIRVLLVDDHVMVRQGLRSVLDAYEGLQVVGEAQDGVEAVKLVEELRPRVVVMDLNMRE